MPIDATIAPLATCANIHIQSKKRLIETLAHTFEQAYEGIDKNTLFDKLVERERLGSTGIGSGIAIPHCRFDTQGRTLCACLTLDEPIDYDAHDNKPVEVVFAMLVPLDANDAHLENLAQIAATMSNADNIALFKKANGDESLHQALSHVEPPLI